MRWLGRSSNKRIPPWQVARDPKERADRNAVLMAYAKELAIAIPYKKGPAKSASILALRDIMTAVREISLPAEVLEKISIDFAQ